MGNPRGLVAGRWGLSQQRASQQRGAAPPPDDRAAARRNLIALALLPLVAWGLINHLYAQPLHAASVPLYWLVDFAQFAALPALLALILHRNGLRPAEYGFRPLPQSWNALEKVAAFVAVWLACWLAYDVVNRVGFAFLSTYANPFGHASIVPAQPGLRILVVAYMAGTAAFVEEAVFRGLPWLYAAQFRATRWTVPAYVLGSAALFAAVHSEQGPHGVLAAFAMGLVAAAIYARLRNLWPLVCAHALIDIATFM